MGSRKIIPRGQAPEPVELPVNGHRDALMRILVGDGLTPSEVREVARVVADIDATLQHVENTVTRIRREQSATSSYTRRLLRSAH